MVQQLSAKGIRVPGGFATTSDAYHNYIAENDLPKMVADSVAAWQDGRVSLQETGQAIRAAIASGHWPKAIEDDIRQITLGRSIDGREFFGQEQ